MMRVIRGRNSEISISWRIHGRMFRPNRRARSSLSKILIATGPFPRQCEVRILTLIHGLPTRWRDSH